MKLFINLLLATFILFTFQNCSLPESAHDEGSSSSLDGSLTNPTMNASSVEAYKATLQPLVSTNCGSCHGASQAPQFAVSNATESHNSLISSNLVKLSSPASSRLVTKIQGGHQTFTSALATQFQTQITAWADILKASSSEPLPEAPMLEPTFSSISALILQPKCVSCHGATIAKDGYRYDTYASTLGSKSDNINLTTPTNSALYQSVVSGNMPEGAPNLTNDEINTILLWIQMGAPNN